MKYKHKKTGEIANRLFNMDFYEVTNGEVIPKRFIEDSCDWEEHVEFNVPIGTKFIHKADDSLVYTISGIKDDRILIDWEIGIQESYTIKSVNQYFKDGTWIKYKEKEWEILEISFKRSDKTEIRSVSTYGEGYITSLLNCDDNKIHSIRRNIDQEVFTIGDTIEHNTAEVRGKILGIHLNKDEYIYFSTSYEKSEMGTRYDNCKKLKVLFITEDGKEVFEGDIIHQINKNFEYTSYKWGYQHGNSGKPLSTYKIFSTEKAAQNYVENHKPCLSFNDVWNLSPIKFGNGNIVLTKKELQELVKSKL